VIEATLKHRHCLHDCSRLRDLSGSGAYDDLDRLYQGEPRDSASAMPLCVQGDSITSAQGEMGDRGGTEPDELGGLDHVRPGDTTLNVVPIRLHLSFYRDYFYSQNCNDIAGAATTLGEAARLAYVKKLHRTEQHKEGGSYDRVEVELRKRIFWQLYNTDK
jgi:hypothetical protein